MNVEITDLTRRYFALLKDMPPRQVPRAVAAAVEQVGLGDKARSRLRTLSGGMLRRTGIGQAIVNQPELLLLDEPTAGLDPEQRVAFRALLRDLGERSSVIVSTHLVEDVGAACGAVALLDAGKIVFRGTPDELTARGEGTGAAGDAPLERGYSAVLAHRDGREAGYWLTCLAAEPEVFPLRLRDLGRSGMQRCPECGAAVSPRSCDGLFQELLALDHSRQAPWGPLHGIAMACFFLQHSSRLPRAARPLHWALLHAYLRGGLATAAPMIERVRQPQSDICRFNPGRRRPARHPASPLWRGIRQGLRAEPGRAPGPAEHEVVQDVHDDGAAPPDQALSAHMPAATP
jgi:hypothetical protein